MHNYPPFEMRSHADKCAFIRARLFGMVITASDGVPVVAHIPMILDPDDNTILEGHVARSNPMSDLLDQGPRAALAVFNGPDAYVSAGYYPSKQRDPRVAPTWNYTAVHASGTLTGFRDPKTLTEHLGRLTDHLEQDQHPPWALSDAPAGFTDRMVTAIVGFRLKITRLEGIRKLSQNSRAEDRNGVLQALGASTHPAEQVLRDEMLRNH